MNASQKTIDSKLTDFVDKNWIVVTVNGNSVIEGTQMTFSMSASGKVKGYAGVNRYFGQWQIEKNQIKASSLAASKMYRAEPKGIMAQEELYLRQLSTITKWHISGKSLQLYQDEKLIVTLKKDGEQHNVIK